jgi:deoxycytidine triphosphate deaminase
MGLKSDKWIRKMSLEHDMISPFCEENIGRGVVSYGLSSYGYDIRVGNEFKIFTNVGGTNIMPNTKAMAKALTLVSIHLLDTLAPNNPPINLPTNIRNQ